MVSQMNSMMGTADAVDELDTRWNEVAKESVIGGIVFQDAPGLQAQQHGISV